MAERVPNETLDAWSGDVDSTARTLSQFVSTTADLTKEQVEQSRRNYEKFREDTKVQRSILDIISAGMLDEKIAKTVQKYVPMYERTMREGKKLDWWSGVDEALVTARKYRVFHWELEFPEACTSGKPSFDLVLTNPPWDAVKPEDDDFFSSYDPKFRRIGNKLQKKKVIDHLLKDRGISQAYDDYRSQIIHRVEYYKNSGQYTKRGSGDTNLWKLFLEKALDIASPSGSISIIIPSGIVTDEGGKQLREQLFQGNIRKMYEFENAKGIFQDVHRSYKFVLLVADKATRKSETFDAAFYLHEIESLSGQSEQEKFFKMPLNLVKNCSPDSLSIPEIRSEHELKVFSKLYEKYALLGDEANSWQVSFIRELEQPGDSDLFRTDGKGWVLIDGKNLHQFIPNFEKPTYTVDPTLGLKRVERHRELKQVNEEIHESFRLAFRRIASSTNVRCVISCIVPSHVFLLNNAPFVFLRIDGKVPKGPPYYHAIAYLAGIFNSYVFDFVLRKRISTTLNFFYLFQTPIPPYANSVFCNKIASIAARLSAIDESFEDLAVSIGTKSGHISMKERIGLTAELNAVVAKHYGLAHGELDLILDSFDGFKEDDQILKMEGDITWTDDLVRKFNGEVRKRVMSYFEKL